MVLNLKFLLESNEPKPTFSKRRNCYFLNSTVVSVEVPRPVKNKNFVDLVNGHGRGIWPFVDQESNQDVSLDKKIRVWKILNAY